MSVRPLKVSIVTISFNQGKYIKETIESILGQDYPDIEYIVVDPGSTDGSRDIITTYSERIAALVFEPDKGPADGLNNGFRRATGEILGFVNADDKLLPGAITKVVSAFLRNPSADVVYGHGFWINGSGKVLRKIHADPFNLRRFIYGCVTFIQPSMFFRKEAFWETGGFNVNNRSSWDGELLADLGLRGREFHLIREDLSCFRLHDTSISGTGRLSDVYQEYKRYLFKKVTGRDRRWYDNLLALEARVEKWLHNPHGFFSNILRVVRNVG